MSIRGSLLPPLAASKVFYALVLQGLTHDWVDGIFFRGQRFGATIMGGAHFIIMKINIFQPVIVDEAYLRPIRPEKTVGSSPLRP